MRAILQHYEVELFEKLKLFRGKGPAGKARRVFDGRSKRFLRKQQVAEKLLDVKRAIYCISHLEAG